MPPRQSFSGFTNSGNGSTTTTANPTVSTVAGNSLFVRASNKGSANASGVTDDAGNTYIRVGTTFHGTNAGESLDNFICLNPVSLSNVQNVTVTFTGSGNSRQIWVEEWPGIYSVDSVFATDDSTTSGSTSPTQVQVTPSQNNSVILVSATYGSTTAPTAASPFTFAGSQASGGGSSNLLASAYQEQVTAALTGCQWTTPFTKTAQVVAVIFTGSGPTPGTATFTGTGTLTAGGTPDIPGTATLTGSGTLTANGIAHRTGTAVFAGTGTLTARSSLTPVALAGTGRLVVHGHIVGGGHWWDVHHRVGSRFGLQKIGKR